MPKTNKTVKRSVPKNKFLVKPPRNATRLTALICALIFIGVGIYIVIITFAATTALEAETIANPNLVANDTLASGGKYVKFTNLTTPPPPTTPSPATPPHLSSPTPVPGRISPET